MAMPKTTETRCRDGRVQARRVTKTTQVTLSLCLSLGSQGYATYILHFDTLME